MLIIYGILSDPVTLGVYYGTLVYFVMVISCTCLSLYAMQVISVKILLSSENAYVKAKRANRHQIIGLCLILGMISFLMAHSITLASGNIKEASLLYILYRFITIYLVAKMALNIPFFL